MSRHKIPANDPQKIVIVGWDNPLQTFFFQVYPASDPEAAPSPWVGTQLREVYELEYLESRIRTWATLMPRMKSILYADKDEGR